MITREQGSGTRITIERVLGMKFNSEIEINSNEAIIEAVQAGLGIGFVSKHTVKLELENSIIKQLNLINFQLRVIGILCIATNRTFTYCTTL
ncbi:RuBisCO operon transcriptional regulator CbbR [uncultured Gammaproteobacteria bacterium]|nr:RuBisCO operon transcriptional regulator CbbR [uncultured Gammaproteobacteria bacterium]